MDAKSKMFLLPMVLASFLGDFIKCGRNPVLYKFPGNLPIFGCTTISGNGTRTHDLRMTLEKRCLPLFYKLEAVLITLMTSL